MKTRCSCGACRLRTRTLHEVETIDHYAPDGKLIDSHEEATNTLILEQRCEECGAMVYRHRMPATRLMSAVFSK